jgi:hypothetical protein
MKGGEQDSTGRKMCRLRAEVARRPHKTPCTILIADYPLAMAA